MGQRAILNYDEVTGRTLERQGYHFVGTHKHSAVKTCLWLWKSMRGEGNCYKGKFYGISAHRCIQMTPSIFCNQSCPELHSLLAPS
jgi:tRNA wybutosine-synthesizing protein 1